MRRICALLLSAVLLAGSASAASWPAWGSDALNWAKETSVSEELLSDPEETVTRGMAAQLLYEAAGRPDVSQELSLIHISAGSARRY